MAQAKAKATATNKAATTQQPAKQAGPQQYIKVVGQPAKPYRANSARHAWWQAVQAHNGKPVSTFVAAVQANPPSTPTKGKLAGKVEPPAGWLGYFVRQGVVQLVNK